MEDKYTIPEYRDLTTDERILLGWLLANGGESTTVYSSQLSRAKVVSRCSCGCPSIDLTVNSSKERTTGPSTILVNAVGVSPEGVKVDVILHTREGRLSELEFVSHDDTTKFTLPKPKTLQVY